jgi:hypothetical protein
LIEDAVVGEVAGASPAGTASHQVCPNGHEIEPGDDACITCGAPVTESAEPASDDLVIGGWRVIARIEPGPDEAEVFRVRHEDTGRTGVLRWFGHGVEPRTRTYAALQSLTHDHLARLMEYGRDDERSWEVWDQSTDMTLASLLAAGELNLEQATALVSQVASALEALEGASLRHGNLGLEAIRFRSGDPDALELGDLSTATLAEFELEASGIGSMTRYASPEAVVGAQSNASDWWSLGVLLIEVLTQGRYFEGVNDRAFLLQVIARGVEIPSDTPDDWTRLLQGLLTRDHARRWSGHEVRRWLAGDRDIPVFYETGLDATRSGPHLLIGGQPVYSAADFALAAATGEHWDEALELVELGQVATWLDAIGQERAAADLKSIMDERLIETDIRFSLALLALNPHLPLVVRGDIKSPNRLLEDPVAAGDWFNRRVVALLKRLKREPWLTRLAERARRVEGRAEELGLSLVRDRFAATRLAAFEARLESFWRARRRMFPDARAPGLAALLERRTLTDEDLILLICAEDAAFKSRGEVLDEAERLSAEVNRGAFDRTVAGDVLDMSKRQLIDLLADRLGAFKRCGEDVLDSWADALRLGRRLSLAQLLVLHDLEASIWMDPPHQDYLRNILQFLQKKVLIGVQRGPLVKLQIGRSASRIDLADLKDGGVDQSVLERLLRRDEQPVALPPSGGRGDERLAKLKRIAKASDLHRRETGVSALVLAWPLVCFEDRTLTGATSIRLAPVMLWPLRIRAAQGQTSIGFDPERDAELNPALERVLGEDVHARWRECLDPALRGEIQTMADLLEALDPLAVCPKTMSLVPVPDAALFKGKPRPEIIPAGAVMLADFPSQAIVEDLRNVLGKPMAGSSLEVLLRLVDPVFAEEPARQGEADRYATLDADPSQEDAVLAARQAPGMKLEGPPGTGKSQTIVNIVTDSIGRGETVMVVCEKQAALEVVHKRLRAEGLSHRVVRIENTQSDRKRLLEELKAQIPAVLASPRDKLSQLQTQRSEAAASMDQLEADLSAYHDAVYSPSEALGLNFRHVAARIAACDAETGGLAAPDLRAVLGKLKPAELEQVVGECVGLLETWYEADLSDPTLSVFRVFSSDAALEARLAEGVSRLSGFEMRRRTALESAQSVAGLPHDVTEEALRQWLENVGGPIQSLTTKPRKRALHWKPLLISRPGDKSQSREKCDLLKRMIVQLREAALTPDERELGEKVSSADRDVLLDLTSGVGLFSAKRPLLDGLNPVSALARGRIRRVLRALRIGETRSAAETACRAASKELQLRKLRAEFEDIARAFDLRENAAHLSAEDLRDRAAKLLAAIVQAISLADDIQACPWPDPLWIALGGAQAVWEGAFLRLAAAADLAAATRSAAKCLSALAQWTADEWTGARGGELGRHVPLTVDLSSIISALPRLGPFQTFRQSRLSDQAIRVFTALESQRAYLDGEDAQRRQRAVAAFVRREAALAWSEQLRREQPVLASPAQKIAGEIDRLSQADSQMRSINQRYLAHVGPDGLASFQSWSQILNIGGVRARRLRQVFEEGREMGLLKARPVWLVNPDVASRIFPLEPGLFDVVIFDEASQMRVENAVPALYRAKRAIVSGDSKQLPPTAFFGSAVSDDDDDIELGETVGEDADAEASDRRRQEAALNRRHVKDCQDLLALSQGVLKERNLTIHYRSAYRELIDFSNAAFYNGLLNIPVNHPAGEVRRHRPVEVRRVDGLYKSQCNRDEAEAVVEHLAALWGGGDADPPTSGVVTFNLKQAELIEDCLQERAAKDRRFRTALEREQGRKMDGEDVSFFVRNLENVQGDERDHIVFSTTFGKDSEGRFKRSFGALTQTGGERRLNVAVTRARSKVTIMTSMPTLEISDFVGRQRGPAKARDYLQAYMRYAELVTAGELDAAQAQLGAFEATSLPAGLDDLQDDADAMVERVRALLADEGFSTAVRPLGGAFAVDVAVIHPQTGLYCLGVELDSPRHPVLNSAKARDIWRPRLLARQGMQLHRVMSAAWATDPGRERQRLLRAALAATEQKGEHA